MKLSPRTREALWAVLGVAMLAILGITAWAAVDFALEHERTLIEQRK